ncbi:hypothetical protein BJF78_31100 [Pseudonocardia sp. CNS-139]|nr:hypothetical protein BJF78_31100 [Pseudonocardia sp. CNS-139]
MGWSWVIRGLVDQLSRWLDAVADLDGPVPAEARAHNHAFLAMVCIGRGELDRAEETVRTALALSAVLPPPLPPLLEILRPAYEMFAHEDTTALAQILAESADPWVRGLAAQVLAAQAENDGEIDEQRRHLRRAHAEFVRTGDRFGLGMTLHSLGELEDVAGESEAAARAYDEAIALATELGNDDDLPQFIGRRAALAARLGNLDEARTLALRGIGSTRGMFTSQATLHMTLATSSGWPATWRPPGPSWTAPRRSCWGPASPSTSGGPTSPARGPAWSWPRATWARRAS